MQPRKWSDWGSLLDIRNVNEKNTKYSFHCKLWDHIFETLITLIIKVVNKINSINKCLRYFCGL